MRPNFSIFFPCTPGIVFGYIPNMNSNYFLGLPLSHHLKSRLLICVSVPVTLKLFEESFFFLSFKLSSLTVGKGLVMDLFNNNTIN